MKEISEKLALEMYELIKDAEKNSDQAYFFAKKGDATAAAHRALLASVRLFELKTHLEWHIEGHLNCEEQSAP
jgi:hypothetical protein